MVNLSEKNKNGILIIKTSFTSLSKFKLIGLVAFSAVAFNLLIFATFIDVEYEHYGVHILDYTTFQELIDLSFWHHIGHFLMLFSVLMLITLITWYTRFIICYLAIEQYQNKALSLKKILVIPFKDIKELCRIAFIYSLTALKKFFDIFSFSTHLENTTHIVTGKIEEIFDEYNKPERLLFIPLISEQSLTFMNALTESERLLRKKFEEKQLSINFSFLYFKYLTGSFICLFLGGTLHFLLNVHIFTTLILCSITILSLESFITHVTLLFNGAVYNYCKKLPTGPFSATIIQKMFTSN